MFVKTFFAESRVVNVAVSKLYLRNGKHTQMCCANWNSTTFCTSKPRVEAAVLVTYLEFPIQVCIPCIGQPITDTASDTDNLVVLIIVMIVNIMLPLT